LLGWLVKIPDSVVLEEYSNGSSIIKLATDIPPLEFFCKNNIVQ